MRLGVGARGPGGPGGGHRADVADMGWAGGWVGGARRMVVDAPAACMLHRRVACPAASARWTAARWACTTAGGCSQYRSSSCCCRCWGRRQCWLPDVASMLQGSAPLPTHTHTHTAAGPSPCLLSTCTPFPSPSSAGPPPNSLLRWHLPALLPAPLDAHPTCSALCFLCLRAAATC